jgi:hypothetical protein
MFLLFIIYFNILFSRAYNISYVDVSSQMHAHNGIGILAAIISAPYEEVLYSDANNTFIENPEHFFDSEQFLSTGALFWSDIKVMSGDSSHLAGLLNVTVSVLYTVSDNSLSLGFRCFLKSLINLLSFFNL